MVFQRFVELGRVALVNFGEDAGKLVVIVNVVDSKRVLVDGADSDVKRQIMNLRRLTLTDTKLPLQFDARHGTVVKAFKAANVTDAFAKSSLGKRLAVRAARAGLTDFDRFKVMVARKSRARAIRAKVAGARKAVVAKKAKA